MVVRGAFFSRLVTPLFFGLYRFVSLVTKFGRCFVRAHARTHGQGIRLDRCENSLRSARVDCIYLRFVLVCFASLFFLDRVFVLGEPCCAIRLKEDGATPAFCCDSWFFTTLLLRAEGRASQLGVRVTSPFLQPQVENGLMA